MRIAINGFGRIGRIAYRSLRQHGSDMDLVAVNDLTDARTLAHLLERDSVHGRLDAAVEASAGRIQVGDDAIEVLSEKDPSRLPWGDLDIDVVIESTGRFRDREQAAQHLTAGARKVIISAPGKSSDITVVMGVNQESITGEHDVISNASCTTNCVATMAKVVLETAGWVHGLMTTTHAYTASQHMLDTPDKDLRRARAGAHSLIPTTTGAAKAAAMVLPELKGKIDGMSMRAPVPTGSVTDLVCRVGRETTVDEVKEAFRAAAGSAPLEGYLQYTEDPIVSSDIKRSPYSCIFDSELTMASGTMVKVFGWYDNEWGYSCRLVDLMGKLL